MELQYYIGENTGTGPLGQLSDSIELCIVELTRVDCIIILNQDFEADFLWKVSLKILNSGIILKTFTNAFIFVISAIHVVCPICRKILVDLNNFSNRPILGAGLVRSCN